ncbi:cytochrome b/b6 domain-containing protein [Shewanella acanthi]|uniref:cytochrome b/b6 domain-containing protein n=1 Tax=Shewanella acanthi TaxID=2864212 RepID=UPI001C655ADD|nr:cytochrome b/b6 domain-containing protein [Shewanella acanthi]QYJ79557.1 cytochrome b/b6 domain-containing protein [Shewanella acanthi]
MNTFFSALLTRLHLLIVLSCTLLVCTSPWILIGKNLRNQASAWDYLHVYLGLVCAALALLFLLRNTLQGKWHQYYAWLVGDWSQLGADIKGLFKGRLPVAGGKGLFSAIEGIGMLLLLATGLSGVFWFAYQGSAAALEWRAYHQIFADIFVGFLVVHLVLAISHIIEFIRQ